MRVSAAYLERVGRDWQKAFRAAHGKTAPAIIYERGWFKIENSAGTKYRRATIEQMTKVLRKGFDD